MIERGFYLSAVGVTATPMITFFHAQLDALCQLHLRRIQRIEETATAMTQVHPCRHLR
jgi:hypothetical protein